MPACARSYANDLATWGCACAQYDISKILTDTECFHTTFCACIWPTLLPPHACVRSYANDLATWGYACALYDISEVLTDTATVVAMRFIIDSCYRDVQVGWFAPIRFLHCKH